MCVALQFWNFAKSMARWMLIFMPNFRITDFILKFTQSTAVLLLFMVQKLPNEWLDS